jgi:hypothetical protein
VKNGFGPETRKCGVCREKPEPKLSYPSDFFGVLHNAWYFVANALFSEEITCLMERPTSVNKGER